MKPPMTTTLCCGERRNGFGEARVGFREERRGLGVAVVGDDDVARIDVHGVHAEVAEGEGDDVAGEALAVAGDGVDGARREFAEDGEAFDEFGEFLEVLVEGAVEFGALGERDDLAGFAGVEVAQVVELRGCSLRVCRRWRMRRWRAACWWSCPWRRRRPRGGATSRAL